MAAQTASSLTLYRSVMVYEKVGSDPENLSYMLHPEGIVSKSNTGYIYRYFKTDHVGSTRAMLTAGANGLIEDQRTDFYPFGLSHESNNTLLNASNRYLFGGKELQNFSGSSLLNLYDFHARYYNPTLGRWFNIDPALQFSNPYLYAGNSPMMFVDPDGRVAWFIPIIIGAVMGGISGYQIGDAHGAKGWDMVGYIAGGAAIGGLSGGVGAGVSAMGGGAMLSGAMAGAVSGAGFSGLATGWNGEAMLKGAAIGALSGFVGGGVSSAIGGGWGAFFGGATSSGLSTALYGGSGEDIALSALLGGATSYGIYEGMSYLGWRGQGKKLGDLEISYRQYKTLQADFQRSRFWGKEYGGFLMDDGSVQRFPKSWRYSHGITPPEGTDIVVPDNARAMYHTHWDAAGKTIYLNANGNRVDGLDILTSGARQFTTAREHGAYDYISIDSYVVNRYETTFNYGGTKNLLTINDLFLRYFPWFHLYK